MLAFDLDVVKPVFFPRTQVHGKNQAHRRHVRAIYDAGVNYVDWIFGEIVSLLKKNGSYDNSLIVVVSDHGEELWEHGRLIFVGENHPLPIRKIRSVMMAQ